MTTRHELRRSGDSLRPIRRIISLAKMLGFALLASLCVLGLSLLLQWFVYDDWLHQSGPLRAVGTAIATLLTFAFVLRWQYVVHQREVLMRQRFEAASLMIDRIRNALQALACMSFVQEPELAGKVREELDRIDRELRALSGAEPLSTRLQSATAAARSSIGSQKSA